MTPISIAIPFYNAEKFLAQAIQSVFAQTYQDWELILIDDGSTDNSLKIAQSVNDARVKVISDGKNKKLASRLNEIAKLAKYDIIARMDADDLMSPTRIEKQMKILEKHPKIDLVSTGVYSVSDKLELIGIRGDAANAVALNDLLSKRIGVVHAAIIGRKDWFLRNPYDTSLSIAQDYDLWLRTSTKNDFNIMLTKEPLYYYREEGNATASKLLRAYKNERKMYNKYAKNMLFPLIIKSYIKSIIVVLLSSIGKLDALLKNRSKSIIDNETIRVFKNEIELIKNTKVSGLIK